MSAGGRRISVAGYRPRRDDHQGGSLGVHRLGCDRSLRDELCDSDGARLHLEAGHRGQLVFTGTLAGFAVAALSTGIVAVVTGRHKRA